jgi:hypothetical protein
LWREEGGKMQRKCEGEGKWSMASLIDCHTQNKIKYGMWGVGKCEGVVGWSVHGGEGREVSESVNPKNL